MREIIRLNDSEPLARGRMRLVFRHPEDPSLLIKVIRPDVIEQRWGSSTPWYKRRRRYGRYISFIRETEEYIAAYASHGGSLPFAQKIIGFAETDLGLGLVMEAVTDKDGNLAPTLAELFINRAFDERAAKALDLFIERIVESDLIVADLNVSNMVYAHDEREGHRFVLIDGLGLATVLPFKLLSRSFNRRSKLGRVKRLRNRMERIQKNHPSPKPVQPPATQ